MTRGKRTFPSRLDYAIWAVAGNALIYGVTVVALDGGAFPWGEIRENGYFVVTHGIAEEVPPNWFWGSYWHGLFTWVSGGVLVSLGICVEAAQASGRAVWRRLLQATVAAALGATWLFAVVIEALRIGH